LGITLAISGASPLKPQNDHEGKKKYENQKNSGWKCLLAKIKLPSVKSAA
jgi:hypothetical protein